MSFVWLQRNLLYPMGGFAAGWIGWTAVERNNLIDLESRRSAQARLRSNLRWLRHEAPPEFIRHALDTNHWFEISSERLEGTEEERVPIRELLRQCAFPEQLDWVSDNITDPIPYLFVEELVHTWASLTFSRHFLLYDQNNNTETPNLSNGVDFLLQLRSDYEVLSSRASNGKASTLDGTDDVLCGLWRKTSSGVLSAPCGWSALAFLTLNPDNAIEFAKHVLNLQRPLFFDEWELKQADGCPPLHQLVTDAQCGAALVAVVEAARQKLEKDHEHSAIPLPFSIVDPKAVNPLELPRLKHTKSVDAAVAFDPLLITLRNVDKALTERAEALKKQHSFSVLSPASWLTGVRGIFWKRNFLKVTQRETTAYDCVIDGAWFPRESSGSLAARSMACEIPSAVSSFDWLTKTYVPKVRSSTPALEKELSSSWRDDCLSEFVVQSVRSLQHWEQC